jgi:hypothetical protein
MRISVIGVWTLAAVFTAGVVPAVVAQAELAAPGLQVFSSDIAGYKKAAVFHGLVFSVALPLAAIGLCLSVAGESYSRRAFRLGAVLALLVGAVVVVAAAVFAWGMNPLDGYGAPPVYSSNSLAMVALPLAALLLASFASLGLTPRFRLPVILFGAPSLFARLTGLGLSAIMRTEDTGILFDTYYALAADHALGVSIILSALGGLACWAAGAERRLRWWLCLLAGGMLLFTGLAAVMITAQLGLAGMPRGYVDYAPAFAEPHGALAIWWAVFGAVMLVVIGWLSALAITARAEPDQEHIAD